MESHLSSAFSAWSADLHWTKYGDDPMFRVNEPWAAGTASSPFPRQVAATTATGLRTRWIMLASVSVGATTAYTGRPFTLLCWIGAAPGAYGGRSGRKDRRQVLRHDGPTRAHYPYHDLRTRRRAIRVAAKNYRLLENSGSHPHTYFARFFRTPDELLVNHHAIPRFKNEYGRPPARRSRRRWYQGTLWLILAG